MGARPAALGEAYAALGDDVFAAGYNPAALARLRQAQVGVQHLIWFREAAAEYVAGAWPLAGGRHVVGASALLFRSGDLERTFADSSGDFDPTRSQGTFTTGNLVAAVTYAYTAGRSEGRPLRTTRPGSSPGSSYEVRGAGPLRVGGSVKLVRDVVDERAEQAVALDVGGQARAAPGLRVGLAVTNLGGNLGAAVLPGAVRAGVVYEGVARLSIPVETTLPLDGSRLKVGGGVEFWIVNGGRAQGPPLRVALRGGVRSGEPLAPAAGLGFSWRTVNLDYAFGWHAEALREAHHISLSYRFGPEPTR